MHRDIYNHEYIKDPKDALEYLNRHNDSYSRLNKTSLENELTDISIKALQYCINNNIEL